MTPSRFKRFIAYIIDGIILSIFSLIVTLLLTLGRTSHMEEFEFFLTRFYPLIWYPVMILYYGFFESSKTQASLGKQVFKLYVSDDNNQRISFGKSITRCIIWLLPLFPVAYIQISSRTMEEYDSRMSTYWWLTLICFIIYFIEFIPVFSKDKKTLYDIFTSTKVSKRVPEERISEEAHPSI